MPPPSPESERSGRYQIAKGEMLYNFDITHDTSASTLLFVHKGGW